MNFKNLFKRTGALLHNLFDRPIRIKLLLFFLPIIIIAVITAGFVAYIVAEKQLKINTYRLLNATLDQTGFIINDRLTTAFEQLIRIENNPAFQSILLTAADMPAKLERYQEIIEINNCFNEIYQRYPQMIDSIYFTLSNGREFLLMNQAIPTRSRWEPLDWLQQYNRGSKDYHWLNLHSDQVITTSKDRKVFSTFKIIGNSTTPVQGLLLINIQQNYLLDRLQNTDLSKNGYFILISPEQNVTPQPVQGACRLPQLLIRQIRQRGQGSMVASSTQKQKLFITFKKININHWILAAVIPEQDILTNLTQIKFSILWITLVLVMATIMIVIILADTITVPIRYLSDQVQQVEQGDFDMKFQVRDQNEIGILAKALTNLMATIKKLLDRVQLEQEQKRQMELMALQSQINPHFLYNTLGSAKHLIDLHDYQRASKMLNALIKFFIIGLSKGREIIAIEDELEHIRNYLMIQQMRYSKDFSFEFSVNPEILQYKIIKLTLQPLVENAIYHGIKNKIGQGVIAIAGWRAGPVIFLEVRDNGPGISPQQLCQLQKSLSNATTSDAGFGLRNVNERLRLHYGIEYGLEIRSQPGQFTVVQIKIPAEPTSS